MQRKLYTRENNNFGIRAGIMALVCLVGAGVIIYNVPPGKWWVEGGVLALVWLGLGWAVSLATRRKKWGLLAAFGVAALLLMQRFEVLSWLSFGIWLVVIGIIFIWA